MRLLPGLAAMLLAAAALLGEVRSSRGGPRILAALGALALLPSISEAEAFPWAALAGAAAALGTPWPCLLAAAGAAFVLMRSATVTSPVALTLAGFAAAVAAGALGSATSARGTRGAGGVWPAAAGGAVLCLALAALDGGRVLLWGFGLGVGEPRFALPGAGLLLGLTLLTAWAGTLSLAAHVLAPSAGGARSAGQRLLVLAGGLAVLGLGLVLYRGLREAPLALSASATGVAGCLLAAGLLVWGLGVLLGSSGGEERTSRDEAEAALQGRVAALLALLALGAAGGEAWLGQGRYATPLVAAAGAAVVLGLVALEPTRLGLLRRAAFLLSLLYLLVV
jgi:hypothetical protein